MEYKIFISSNQIELKEERLAIKQIINDTPTLRNSFEVFLFEDLPAKGKSPKGTYLKNVENSDIYIGIIGAKYGKIGEDSLSATEREFRTFLKKKKMKEIFFFIKGSDQEDYKRDKNSQLFIKDIQKAYIYKRFNNIDELKTNILSSLLSFLDSQGAIIKGPFDQVINKNVSYNDIDEQVVQDFLEYRARKRSVSIPAISIKDTLVKTLGIVKDIDGKLVPNNTALLFFGKFPEDYIPQHEIRIARFRGTERIEFLDSQKITGSIYKMLNRVEKFFKRNTRVANKIVDFTGVSIPEYPYEAIREGVINAIAHRDYLQRGAPIIISIFDDRVEISNPGGLLPGLNIKNLEGHHKTRNKEICKIFHETTEMETFGTGIKKMKKLMKEHGLDAPKFCEEGDFFVVRFYGPGEKILDLVPSIPKERITDLRKLGLNKRQIEALKLMINQREYFTNKKYRELFNVTNKTAATDLNFLVKKGFIKVQGKGPSTGYLAK